MTSQRFGLTGTACLALVLTACPDDPPTESGGSGSSDTGASTTTGTTIPVDDSTTVIPDDTTGGSSGSSGGTTEGPATDGSSTGPICDVGTENCACDGGTCEAGLACVGDVCVATSCGDGTVDAGEECDDGNMVSGDGCEDDCTFTPGVAQIDLGDEHTCALLNRQAVRCWGRGTSGRLGYGNTDDIGDDELPSSVGDVQLDGPAVEIALGSNFTCARLDDGDIQCWGFNGDGQLGLGHTAPVGDFLLPRAFPTVSFPAPAIDIAAGTDHACAVVDTGEVYCWGNNNAGQLGYGNVVDVGDDEDPATVGPVSLGGLATQVAAGEAFTCALLDTGEVRCWGEGTSGRLGLAMGTTDIGNDELPDSVPVLDLGGLAVAVAAGDDHACARLDTDEIVCWGEGGLGRLGYGNTTDIGDNEVPATAGMVSVGAAVVSLGLGTTHTCAATDVGEVRCWGEATGGLLGNVAPGTDVGDNELPSDVPIVDVGAVVVSLEAGAGHTCVVLDNGGVKCWGNATRGQLGYGDTVTIGDDEAPSAVGEVAIE